MEITVKEVRKNDQIMLTKGIIEVVKKIKTTNKNNNYLDIHTDFDVFEVHKDTNVRLVYRQ